MQAAQSEANLLPLSLREKTAKFVTNPLFQNFIMGVIILNGIILGLETSQTVKNMGLSHTLELIDTACFWFNADCLLCGSSNGNKAFCR